MPNNDRPLLAVLIDADNVPAKFAAAILEEVKLIGEPALRRVYGDWSTGHLSKWAEQIHKLGLEARQATATSKQKNASDISLVIDAMDILHSQRFDGFVLVSSDSDFTSLASRLRENGLMVIGMGETKTLEALRNVCNRFILVENLDTGEENATKAKDSKSKLPMNHAYQRISNAMRNIEQDEDWYNLSQIKNIITASHTDFDQRSYGHAKFSSLIKAMSDKLETRTEGKTILVRMKQ